MYMCVYFNMLWKQTNTQLCKFNHFQIENFKIYTAILSVLVNFGLCMRVSSPRQQGFFFVVPSHFFLPKPPSPKKY